MMKKYVLACGVAATAIAIANIKCLDEHIPLIGLVPWFGVLLRSGLVLILLGIAVLAMRAEVRSRSHEVSLLTPAAGLMGACFLVLPGICYALVAERCGDMEANVIHAFILGTLAVGALVLGLVNGAAMDRVDAVGATAIQVGTLALILAAGTLPAMVIFLLGHMPSGGLNAC